MQTLRRRTGRRSDGHRLDGRRGFTLIELLCIVIIISVLAMIAIAKFRDSKQRGYLTTMKTDLRNLATTAEALYATEQSYAGLTAQGSAGVTLSITSDATSWKGEATHAAFPGKVCTIEAGNSSLNKVEPICN